MQSALAGQSTYYGQTIKTNAERLSNRASNSYARANAPSSPFPELSGNKQPGKTKIQWLKGLNKCNQFVGDVLTYAGLKMPTWRMPDGSQHYMHAEALPKQSSFFKRLSDLEQVQAGDIMVLDWDSSGENGAHVEIVSKLDINNGKLFTIGARKHGATEQDSSDILHNLKVNRANGAWHNLLNGRAFDLYFLRPFRAILKKNVL